MIRNQKVSGKLLISSVQERVIDWSLYNIRRSLRTKKMEPPKTEPERYTTQNREAQETRTESGKKSLSKSLRRDTSKFMNGTVRFFFTPSSSAYARILGLKHKEVSYEPVSKNPWNSLKFILQNKNALELFISFVSLGLLTFLYATMCLGIHAAIKDGRKETVLLFLLVIAYFWLASAPFTQDMRYRLPVMPYVILLASHGILFLRTAIIKRQEKMFPEKETGADSTG
jgi:hypothetical protein